MINELVTNLILSIIKYEKNNYTKYIQHNKSLDILRNQKL